MVRIGTSGWVYNHWRGVFYPQELRQRDWFDHYSRSFDTVEINNTFYRLPGAATIDSWRDQAPQDFVYAVKASRFLTHVKRLKDPEEPLHLFFDRVDHLGETLGPVLYQLPPNWRPDLSRFEHFLSVLPKEHLHVVEFRDARWLVEEVFAMMEQHRISLCFHDMTPLQVPLRVTAPPVYIRLHGDLHHAGDYDLATLEQWAQRIFDWRSQEFDVFVYFNNDVGGYAPKNAITLKNLTGCRK